MFSRADLIAGFDPELARAIADETRRNGTVVEATAVAASVLVATSRDVSALLFVDQVTTGKHLDRPRVDRNRVLVTLSRDTGRWLVTGLTAV